MKHILIIPGLGDNYSALDFQTRKWEKMYGIVPHIYVFGWQEKGSFDARFALLEKEISNLYKKYGKISVVGSSAGGSAAINLYAKNKNKIDKVICVCARLSDPDVRQRFYFPKNKIDSFVASIRLCEKNIVKLKPADKKNILTIRPIADDVVPVRTMTISGATNKRIIAVQHMIGIYMAITWHSRMIADFIRG